MSSRNRKATPFDRLLKQQCQKGASKSAGVVGKWGATSFTSIRATPSVVNGASSAAAPKPKKFFKSRQKDPEPEDDAMAGIITPVVAQQPVQPQPPPQPKKFFTSGSKRKLPSPEPEPEMTSHPEEETQLKVPPLKLRLKTAAASQLPESPDQPQDEDSEESSDEDIEVSFKESPEKLNEVIDHQNGDQSWLSEEVHKHRETLEREFRDPTPPLPSPPPEPASIPAIPAPETPESCVNKSLAKASYSRRAYGRSTVNTEKNTEVSEPIDTYSNRSYGRTRAEPSEVAVSESVKPSIKEEEPTTKETYGRVQGNPELSVEAVSHSPVMASYSRRAYGRTKKDPGPNKPVSLEESLIDAKSTKSIDAATKSEDVFSLERANTEPLTKEASTGSQPLTTGESTKKFFTKKKSIFKSKASQGDGGKRSLYKHNWNQDDQESAAATTSDGGFKTKVMERVLSGKTSTGQSYDDFDDFGDGPSVSEMSFSSNRLVRVTSNAATHHDETAQEVTSVKCPKAQKGYYTVIKNVKKAHQIQDSGEFQEFNDDVEYILEGLGKHNNLSTRCLSTVTLASKCTEPAFRMHLRAHGTVTKFFSELKDAPENSSLALCASTVLFVLSQDRLNMDLDRESLELMLNLLDTESRIKDALDGSGMNQRELQKNKQKVQDLVEAMKSKGRAANLSLENISADHLAMETLLSLTSKRAGEWFKEELRELGGLDHLVKTMSDCLDFLTADEISMWTEPLHNKLKKADRVLKVLESVTYENEENCQFLLEHESGKFLDLIHNFFKLLDEELPLNPSTDIQEKDSISHTLRESLLDVIRVYINLVHDYKHTAFGSRLSGQKEGVFELILHCMFVIPDYLPEQKRFDILVLSLTLIINLVEHCQPNRRLLMSAVVPLKADQLFQTKDSNTAPEEFVKMFLFKEENARRLETKTDKILDGEKEEDEEAQTESKEEEKGKSHEEFIDETVKKLLNKAGKHMEDTLIASYLTLIIGYLILDDKEYEKQIRTLLPDNNFSLMVSILKKFFNFVNLTASSTVASNRGLKATEMILKHLEILDKPESEKNPKTEPKDDDNFDDLTIFDDSKDEEEDEASNATDSATATSTLFNDDFGKLF